MILPSRSSTTGSMPSMNFACTAVSRQARVALASASAERYRATAFARRVLALAFAFAFACRVRVARSRVAYEAVFSSAGFSNIAPPTNTSPEVTTNPAPAS